MLVRTRLKRIIISSTVIAHAQHIRAAPLQASIGIPRAARNYIILILISVHVLRDPESFINKL